MVSDSGSLESVQFLKGTDLQRKTIALATLGIRHTKRPVPHALYPFSRLLLPYPPKRVSYDCTSAGTMTAECLQTAAAMSNAPDKHPQEHPQDNIWLITYLLRIYHQVFNVTPALWGLNKCTASARQPTKAALSTRRGDPLPS